MNRMTRINTRLPLQILPALALLGALAAPLAAETSPTDPMPPPETGTMDLPLSAEAFDAMTQGRTFDTHDAETGLYGIESFYPDRKVVWKDAEGCQRGTWYQSGPQICFDYEGGVNNPICWTYHDRGSWIMGWFRGDRQTVPIMLYPSKGPAVSCGEFLGS